MTPNPRLVPAILLLLAGTLACTPKPSEAFLEQVKATVRPQEQPGFEISTGIPAEVTVAKASEVRAEAEILANKLGFRIEIGHGKKGFLPTTTYSVQDFKAPTLPGLSFQKDGEAVKILADLQQEMVIESALPPKEGFLALQRRGKTSAERESEIAAAKALGIKDARNAVDAEITAQKEKVAERAESFAEAVEKIRKDNGFKRAWFVHYRIKSECAVPENSPFWELAKAWMATKGEGFTIMPNAALMVLDEQHQWVEKRGQLEVKDSLETYSVIAFEGADGKLAKTEGWKSFLAE